MFEPWPKAGTHVMYCDPHGNNHSALVTTVFGTPETSPSEYGPTINVVFVSGDEKKQDGYGRQIERQTSICHGKNPSAVHGQYWRYCYEERNPVVPSSS